VADHCDECGFTYKLHLAPAAGEDIRERVAEVAAILRSRDIDTRSRTRSDVWSPLEYGCHLRDVLLVQRERVLAARRVDLAAARIAHGVDVQLTPDAAHRVLGDI
jgi:hypothetical protein